MAGKLTDTAIRNAKPSDKARKITDERGLYLLVTPSGGKWWRFKYLFGGKEKLLSLGVSPDIFLADARERREAARKMVAQGIRPRRNPQRGAGQGRRGRADLPGGRLGGGWLRTVEDPQTDPVISSISIGPDFLNPGPLRAAVTKVLLRGHLLAAAL